SEKGIGEPTGSGPAVELRVPIFDFQQASSARINARLRQSAFTVAALETQIRLEVRLAYSELTAARKSAERYKTALLPLSRTVADETLKNYDFMLLGVYDVLRARREQFEAQSEYIGSLRDYWTAWSNLERALGGKIPSDLASTLSEEPKVQPAAPQPPAPAPQEHPHEGDTP
ncbi:MAG: TolC family protein, partial [Elusimicrobia bacterium]|nr:TolC family protein [Elusimicrobiota bacterium]